MGEVNSHWAILIGVGVSAAKENIPVLRGAAPDVITAKEYLETSTDSKRIDITLLVADESPGNCDPELLPTYKNVVSALLKVIRLGKSGQFVCIYFSGHGTRCLPHFDGSQLPSSRSSTGALALVLHDRYFYGERLRSALVKMGEKGMHVTLILDCCFSGSVLRAHNNKAGRRANIRFLEVDPVIHALSSCEDPFATASSAMSELRNAKVQKDPLSLLNPDKYTIIAACGPHETATEMEFSGGARRGALSYFFLDTLQTLKRCGAQIKHQSLHQHLCARFHAEYPHQTPMQYGSNGVSFFQDLASGKPGQRFISVWRDRTDGRLVLSAGQAHGVHVADVYAAYRWYGLENAGVVKSQEAGFIKLVVTAVGCLTSQLLPVNSSDDVRLERGSMWKARCLNSYALQKVRIRLRSSVCDTEREDLAGAAQRHPFLCLSTDENEAEPSVYQVAVNHDAAYEVQNAASERILSLPTLALSATSTRSALMEMLGHLATFKYFERILNRAPDRAFESSFWVECNRTAAPEGCFKVKDGDLWSLTCRNLDTSPKYVALFNFSPAWQVSNLVAGAGGGSFLVVPPKRGLNSGEVEIPMTMTVPAHIRDQRLGEGEEGGGDHVVEDVVKVFVTARPSTFPHMILPPLGDGMVRGGIGQLARLLQGLRNANRKDGGTEAQWSCRNFTIQTSL